MGLAAGGILPVWGALMAAIFGVANVGRSMGLQAPIISLGRDARATGSPGASTG